MRAEMEVARVDVEVLFERERDERQLQLKNIKEDVEEDKRRTRVVACMVFL